MSKFQKDQIVCLIDGSYESFVVIIPEPDSVLGIVIKSLSDNEYCIVHEDDLVSEKKTFKGRFWISISGNVYFAVEDVVKAWDAGFKTFEGLIDQPDTRPTFSKWVSETVEVEMT